MITLTPEQLKRVTEQAALLLSPTLIAISIGLDPIVFKALVNDPEEALHKAYYDGYIQAKMNINQKTLASAADGDVSARIDARSLLSESENFF